VPRLLNYTKPINRSLKMCVCVCVCEREREREREPLGMVGSSGRIKVESKEGSWWCKAN
jgi:hypothetical protein